MSFIFTQLASDNFTRADENPLSQGGNWTTSSFGAFLQVVSNTCEGTVINVSNSMIYTGISFPDDQYAEVPIPASGETLNSNLGLQVRWRASVSANETGYVYVVEFNGGAFPQTIPIFPFYYSGGLHAIGSTFNLTINAADVLRLAVVGNTLYFYQNGTLVDTRTDNHFDTGSPGLYMVPKDSLSDVAVTLWAAGSVTTPGTSNLSQILRWGHGSRMTPPYNP